MITSTPHRSPSRSRAPRRRFQFIDKQGDSLYAFPHLFVDFGNRGPFDAFWEYLKHGYDSWSGVKDLRRIEFFPKTFSKREFGKIFKDKSIVLPDYLIARLKHEGRTVFFDFSNEYGFLNATDVIHVADKAEKEHKTYLEVTHRFQKSIDQLHEESPNLDWEIAQQGGKDLAPSQVVNVFEVKQVYEFDLKR